MRSIVYLLTRSLFGKSRVLADLPVQKSIRGAGLSDWDGYATGLAEKFAYTNTFLHKEPALDIVAPPKAMLGSLDFLISTDVFEHVLPPVERAFDGAWMLLKPGGTFVFTVPYITEGTTLERYPHCRDYQVVRLGGRSCVVWIDRDQQIALDTTPVFHGGEGETLEIRQFSLPDVRKYLSDAGFVDVTVFDTPVPECGLAFPLPWSLPIVARKATAS